MFDTNVTVHRHVSESVTRNVNITEQRAPTDESVKLFTELKAKAREQLVSITRLENTEFSGVMHVFKDSCSLSFNIIVRFKLNDKVRTVKLEVPDYKLQLEVAELVRDAVAKDIASVLTGAFAAKCPDLRMIQR